MSYTNGTAHVCPTQPHGAHLRLNQTAASREKQ